MTKKHTLALMILAVGLAAVNTGCARRARGPYVGPPDYRIATGVGVAPGLQPPPAPAYAPPPPQAPAPVSLAGQVVADGYGAPNPGMAPAQARLMAKRAAQLDAQRNLLEEVKGVSISSGTTVNNFMTQNDTINSRVNGFVQGAQIIDEGQEADGTYHVRLAVDLAGIGGIINQYGGGAPGGYAPPPPPPPMQQPMQGGAVNPAQARAMAERAAKLDAQRQLLEMAKGIRIDSSSSVNDFMLQNDSIRSRIEGIIRGAEVVDKRYTGDGGVEVDMRIDFNLIRYNVR